jgi:phosphatidylglycerophosphatase A
MTEPRSIWRSSPGHFLAFGFGSGLAPVAPGTFGTLAALPLWWVLSPLAVLPYLAVATLLFVVGVAVCARTTRALGVHDHSAIVWDEVVGFLLTMTAAPAVWWAPVVGFAAFRLFDITKPWPIRWIDRRVEGGLGIMLDDMLAAVPAWALVQSTAWLVK